jgi:ribosome-interacting GTPase 1
MAIESKFASTGYITRHGGDVEIVCRQLANGLWRAYEAEHVWGYSHRHGGQTHHVNTRVLRDSDGDFVQATSQTALLNLLAKHPALKLE